MNRSLLLLTDRASCAVNADRLEQISRCTREIHRCESELASDKTGTGAWLGYMDWLEELHYQIWGIPEMRWKPGDVVNVPYCDYVELSKQHVSIGGGPTRATILPEEPAERKKYPVASGFMDYFPDAIAAISNLSYIGNEQHNPGQPLHWARGKSTDEADTMLRHFLQRGTLDKDGVRHTVKMAWRALALLQKELEAEQETK